MAQGRKPRKDGALIRIMKAPIRALSKALDVYLGDTVFPGYGVVGYPHASPGLSRSFSQQGRRNSQEDYRELVRAATQNSRGALNTRSNPLTMERSRSVAIDRIDEDKPCEFGPVGVPMFDYSRSRSCKSSVKWSSR